MKEKIIDYLDSTKPNVKNTNELAVALKYESAEDFKNLVIALNELENEYVIMRDKDNNYGLLKEMGYFVGKFILKRGFLSFLVSLDNSFEDIVITKNYISNALDDDIVLAKKLPVNISSRKQVHAEIVKVLKRKNTFLIGTIKKAGRDFQLRVDNLRAPLKNITIPHKKLNGAVAGHKVYCEIIEVTSSRKIFAKVLHILGHKNDPNADILGAVYKNGFSPIFPESVLNETKTIEETISDTALSNRVDLRNDSIFTIDGDDAKDLDDAISIKLLENGNYLLGVHIADVSYYVREGSELDKEAYNRSTSVYLVDRVVPMLPHYLSNGVCSLNEKVDRLTISCIMEIDSSGKVISHSIKPTVINSKGRLTYKKVNLLLDGDKGASKEYKKFKDELFLANKLALILNNKRKARGSINFEIDEAKILVDDDLKPYDIVLRKRGDAEKLIEEFMLVANETVAEHFHWLNLPFIYRVHETPNIDKLNNLITVTKALGYNINLKNNTIHPNVLRELCSAVANTKDERVINTLMLRTFAKAKYSEESLGHFGLASNFYTHFTSPIRRYPDTIVHRLIREYLISGHTDEATLKKYESLMPNIAIQTSKKERDAISAEREVNNMKKAEYMIQYIGNEFLGIISGITSWGIYVELPNTVEGLIHISDLDDENYFFDDKKLRLIGNSSGKTFNIGDEVLVIVKDANKKLGEIDFTLKTN